MRNQKGSLRPTEQAGKETKMNLHELQAAIERLTEEEKKELQSALKPARKKRKYLSVDELVSAVPAELGVEISKAPAFAQAVAESQAGLLTPFYYKARRKRKVKEVEPETERVLYIVEPEEVEPEVDFS